MSWAFNPLKWSDVKEVYKMQVLYVKVVNGSEISDEIIKLSEISGVLDTKEFNGIIDLLKFIFVVLDLRRIHQII
jgi:hypothetical protein